jgi:hypothetical protein
MVSVTPHIATLTLQMSAGNALGLHNVGVLHRHVGVLLDDDLLQTQTDMDMCAQYLHAQRIPIGL